MSIYSSLWRIKIDLDWDNWVEVYAQGVDSHIGQPSEGYETDPYADFLPPIVTPYDPEKWPGPIRRAVVIVARGRDEKDGQRYVDPLMTLTGKEYAEIPFPVLMERIEDAINDNAATLG